MLVKIRGHLFPKHMGAHLRLTILEHQSKDGNKRADGRRTGKNWNCWYESSLDTLSIRYLSQWQGRGAFGSVVKARNKIDSRVYAGMVLY